MGSLIQPDVFEYDDYRSFLKDHFEFKKKADPRFTHRKFSALAGLKSPSALLGIVTGKKNMSKETIEKVSKALSLSRDQATFFRNLVLLNQTQSAAEKRQYARQLMWTRGFKKRIPLAEAKFNYFSNWHNIAIRELIAIEGFQADPNWIAQKLGNRISAKEAEKSLRDLTDLGLIAPATSGNLQQTDRGIVTADQVTNTLVSQIHSDLLKLASESIYKDDSSRRDIIGITFAASDNTVNVIKELVSNFRREIEQILEQDKSPTQVYQFSLALFPLSDEKKL